MSTQQIPPRYQPDDRVVDDRDRLRELYCNRGLTIREIANEYAEVGRSTVCDAIHDHGLDNETEPPEPKRKSDRGTDPPSWTQYVSSS